MTEMFGEAWPPMSVPDLAPDDDDDSDLIVTFYRFGRKRILLFSTVGHLISALVVPWVKTYSLFVIVRFLIAFFGTGMLLSAFVMGESLLCLFHLR